MNGMEGSRKAAKVRRAIPWIAAGTALALLAFAVPAAAVNQADLLDPQDAFRLSARVLDKRSVQVEFRIAPGYYLYRDRFRFETAAGRLIAEAELPRGKVKEDQFFGRTETYRDRVSIRVPLTGAEAASGKVKVKVISQGCADAGVCYIPQEQWVEVRLDGR